MKSERASMAKFFGKERFGSSDSEILGEKVLYQGFFKMLRYRVRHRLFRGGWSEPFDRELFWRPRAVGVLPYDPRRDLVGLIEQFRIGAVHRESGPWLLEVVAGLLEDNENLEDVARRELVEEAGLQVERLIPMHDVLLTPGGSNERIALYCGLAELHGGGGIFGIPEENEDIRLHVVSRREALAALDAGECDNAPLTIALQWLALHYGELKQ